MTPTTEPKESGEKVAFKVTEHVGIFYVQDVSPSGLIWAMCPNKDRAHQIVDALNQRNTRAE